MIGGVGDTSSSTPTKSRGAQLRRAGSAEAGGGGSVVAAAGTSAAAHALLCRTGSQDNPHQMESNMPTQGGGGVGSSTSSPLTKSLPRI